MDGIGFTDMLASKLIAYSEDSKNGLPKTKDCWYSLIHTQVQVILDPRVNNFEEAKRSTMFHKEMSISRVGSLTKKLESLDDYILRLNKDFMIFWSKKIGLFETDYRLIIHLDGHGVPYFTKEYFLCGRMSVTEKIAPGTHYVIANVESGFILCLFPQQANTHLNDGVYEVSSWLNERLEDKLVLIVVDRECNGNGFNLILKNEFGFSVLTGLRSNQYSTIDDFDYTWLEKDKLAYGKWKIEEKREKDSRTFLLYPKEHKLLVFVTTEEDAEFYTQALSVYKSRWPFNEGILKLLVHEFDLNRNICNGTYQIDNPKINVLDNKYQEKIEKCDSKIKNHEIKKAGACSSEQKRRNDSIKKWEMKKESHKEQCKCEKEKVPDKAGVRKLGPQAVIALESAALLNMLLYLITQIFPEQNPLSIGIEAILDLLINRSGFITDNKNEFLFLFDPPERKKDYELLSDFLKGITKLELRGRNGKIIKARIRLPDS